MSNTRTSGAVSFEVVSSAGKPLIQTISSKVDEGEVVVRVRRGAVPRLRQR